MKIETFVHNGVNEDGTFKNQPGCVETKGKILMSAENGGCNIESCHCSDGHWLTIIKARTHQGVVEGVQVIFDNQAEMNEFFKIREMYAS